MQNATKPVPVLAQKQKEKGWIATIIDAAAGRAADTAATRAVSTGKEQIKQEIVSVKQETVQKIDGKVDEIVGGDKSKYLILGAFIMSALSLGLEVWNHHAGGRTSQSAPTIVNVYYGQPKVVSKPINGVRK